MLETVAIQGEAGSFRPAAAIETHGRGLRLLPCPPVAAVVRAGAAGGASRGVVPIENTLAGSVHENYDLLSAHALHVVGETELRIRPCLIAPPRVTPPEGRGVASPPVALAQCRRFFVTHPEVEAVPAYDTAGSVRDVMAGKVEADAAIASKLAAELYGADVIAEGLEDHAENYTRFLVVAREPGPRRGAANKTSLMLSLGNTPGTLYRALGVFAGRGLNLTKIESRPIPGRPWEYRFYLDGGGCGQGLDAALEELRAFTFGIRVLGTYPPR